MHVAPLRAALALALTLTATRAIAADAGREPQTAAEIATLKREVAANHGTLMRLPRAGAGAEALSADACATACLALRSMRRATERLCALDPGADCDDARRRTADADARVTETCPSCVADGERREASEKPVTVTPTMDAANEARAATVQSTPAAQDSAPRRGGCAGCATTSAPAERHGLSTVIALGLLAALRSRSRRRRP